MRFLKLTTLFALPLAFALSLGAAPQSAEAGVCKKLGFSKKCVVRGDIKKNAINSSRVKDGSLTGVDLLDGSIGAADLGADSVGASEIATGAVGASEVANGSLTADDLADEAGTDYSSGGANPNLAVTPDTILSVTITAPSAGHVIVNTSGYFFYDTNGGAATYSITTGATVDLAFEIRTQVIGTATDTEFTPFAGTRGFAVSAGSTIFNLVCVENIPNVAVRDAVLTAMYFPTLY